MTSAGQSVLPSLSPPVLCPGYLTVSPREDHRVWPWCGPFSLVLFKQSSSQASVDFKMIKGGHVSRCVHACVWGAADIKFLSSVGTEAKRKKFKMLKVCARLCLNVCGTSVRMCVHKCVCVCLSQRLMPNVFLGSLSYILNRSFSFETRTCPLVWSYLSVCSRDSLVSPPERWDWRQTAMSIWLLWGSGDSASSLHGKCFIYWAISS